ncbi:hypothetical protein MMC09_005328 [Bachmanniomyces sp. S44760]|nr:hypothetical protein [Bachmanniomyces sp. S44760]
MPWTTPNAPTTGSTESSRQTRSQLKESPGQTSKDDLRLSSSEELSPTNRNPQTTRRSTRQGRKSDAQEQLFWKSASKDQRHKRIFISRDTPAPSSEVALSNRQRSLSPEGCIVVERRLEIPSISTDQASLPKRPSNSRLRSNATADLDPEDFDDVVGTTDMLVNSDECNEAVIELYSRRNAKRVNKSTRFSTLEKWHLYPRRTRGYDKKQSSANSNPILVQQLPATPDSIRGDFTQILKGRPKDRLELEEPASTSQGKSTMIVPKTSHDMSMARGTPGHCVFQTNAATTDGLRFTNRGLFLSPPQIFQLVTGQWVSHGSNTTMLDDLPDDIKNQDERFTQALKSTPPACEEFSRQQVSPVASLVPFHAKSE